MEVSDNTMLFLILLVAIAAWAGSLLLRWLKGDNRLINGGIAITAGAFILFGAFGSRVTVNNYYNDGLLHNRLLWFVLGSTLIIVGVIQNGFNAAIKATQDSTKKPPESKPIPDAPPIVTKVSTPKAKGKVYDLDDDIATMMRSPQ